LGRISSLLGRAKGDELLQTASILGDWIQPGNLVTRPSSDEFVTVLPWRRPAISKQCRRRPRSGLQARRWSPEELATPPPLRDNFG
jgi:GGDEF domain-containing protein